MKGFPNKHVHIKIRTHAKEELITVQRSPINRITRQKPLPCVLRNHLYSSNITLFYGSDFPTHPNSIFKGVFLCKLDLD